MADTTNKYNLRYPEDGDTIDAQQIEDLANDVEATFNSRTAVSATHTVSLQNGWVANANNPLVFERVGDIVYVRGEVYHPNTDPAASEVIGVVPAAYRPTFERVGPIVIATNVPGQEARLFIDQTGNVSINQASRKNSTPGYGIYISYVRAL